MKEYLISTKADTLADLREIVKHSYIEELSIVYAEDFFGNPAGVIAAIKEQFTGETIVVRSSSKSEDNLETSNAGHFESVLGVDASKDAAITEAIETVYRSYVEGDFTEEAKQQLIEANELPQVCFHSLRHSSITYKLKLNGGDIKAVQGDSGHAQATMVTDQYSHILDESRRNNVQLFEQAFYGGKGVKIVPEAQDKAVEEQVQQAGLNSEVLLKIFSNPDMVAMLKMLAKTLG